MKTKLTLRIDEDVKQAAKQLARERGDSLSGLVERYFQLLIEQPASPNLNEVPPPEESDSEESLGPVTRRIKGAMGDSPESHGSSKSADRRAAAEAAHRKHS